MNSNRLNGHRLLFVIALFGILSTHVISAEGEVEEATTLAAAPDESEPAGDQSTPGDSAAATEVGTETSVAQEITQASAGESAGETSTSAGEAITGGGEDGVTGGPGGGETATSAEELSSTGTVSDQVQAGSDITVLDSSREGTEGGTTAILTGAPSTGEPGVATIQEVEYTTGRATAEETTASVKQTTETATAEHTASAGHPGAEGQRETTRKEAEQSTASISSLATSGYTEECEQCQATYIRAKSATWKYSVSICKAENKYRVAIVIQNQNTNQTKTSTKESTYKPDCSTVVSQLRAELRKMVAKKRSNMPSTTTMAVGVPPNNRKRRHAEATTVEPDTIEADDMDLDSDDLDEVADNVLKIVTNDSSETTSSKIVLAESSVASSTTSATLTTAPIDNLPPKRVEEQKKPSKPDVWEAHYGLFLTIVILISVCVVVSAVCCLCMVWRRRGQEKHSDKQPIAMEEAREGPASVSNPIPDAEMIQDEAPMQERENPAVTPNGGGQHISKADEDNGWVVPLDELSKAEKEKPEVENTRL